jgi:hypothetical protein
VKTLFLRSVCSVVAVDSGLRGADGAILTPAQIQAMDSSRMGSRNSNPAPQPVALNEASVRKDGRYTYRDGDKGDLGLCQKFLVLNDELISGGTFSFTHKWATIHDRNIDENTKQLLQLFGTKNLNEFDFGIEAMLHEKYGVAPWSVKKQPRSLCRPQSFFCLLYPLLAMNRISLFSELAI